MSASASGPVSAGTIGDVPKGDIFEFQKMMDGNTFSPEIQLGETTKRLTDAELENLVIVLRKRGFNTSAQIQDHLKQTSHFITPEQITLIFRQLGRGKKGRPRPVFPRPPEELTEYELEQQNAYFENPAHTTFVEEVLRAHGLIEEAKPVEDPLFGQSRVFFDEEAFRKANRTAGQGESTRDQDFEAYTAGQLADKLRDIERKLQEPSLQKVGESIQVVLLNSFDLLLATADKVLTRIMRRF